MANSRKRPTLKEERATFSGAPLTSGERQAKLARLRRAIIEGERSGRAADSSMASILTELDAESGTKR